eukprot:747564-Hanusia_phi.AAC.5
MEGWVEWGPPHEIPTLETSEDHPFVSKVPHPTMKRNHLFGCKGGPPREGCNFQTSGFNFRGGWVSGRILMTPPIMFGLETYVLPTYPHSTLACYPTPSKIFHPPIRYTPCTKS